MGQPATFIRFSGCNLRCEGCDTDHSKHRDLRLHQVLDEVDQLGNKLIVVTGGEPTLSKELPKLAFILSKLDYIIDLETNGTNHIWDYSTYRNIVISPKKGSKVEYPTEYNAWYKYVIGTADWCWSTEEVLRDISCHTLNPDRVYLMPYGLDLKNAGEVWDFCTASNLRYSDRLQWRVSRK